MSNVQCSYEKTREKVKAELLQRQEAEKNALATVMLLLGNDITEECLLSAVSVYVYMCILLLGYVYVCALMCLLSLSSGAQ